MRLIVGISGASGVIMGYRLLQALKNYPEIETHLVISKGAVRNFKEETDLEIRQVNELADYVHDNRNLAASISSGSFVTAGMMIVPCSMKTLSGIANGYTSNLLTRAADVCLKERRKVVLAPRETPLNRIHLHNMQMAAEYGCSIVPPMLTFYNNLQTTEEQLQHVLGKVLMQFGLKHEKFVAWQGR